MDAKGHDMSEFTKNYVLDDILYGRFDVTQRYWQELISDRDDIFQRFLSQEKLRANCPKALKSSNAKKLSELQPKEQNHAKDSQTHAVISYLHKGFEVQNSEVSNIEKMRKGNDALPPRYAEKRPDYHEALYSSPYSPFRCIQFNEETGAAAVTKVANYDAYLRRACKFGAVQGGMVVGARIHFALDNIKLEDVLGKTNFPEKPGSQVYKVPITTSEIRALFRSWPTVQHNVCFYVDLKEVKPPWVEDEKAWVDYGKVRCQKYGAILIKQGKEKLLQDMSNVNDINRLREAGNLMKSQAVPEFN
jgi:hypothetical protein